MRKGNPNFPKIIIAGSNTKISKTHRLLNKVLLSFFVLLSVYCDLRFLCLPQRQSFFSSSTLQNYEEFWTPQGIASALYSFVFYFENNFLQLNIATFITNQIYSNFNLHYFMSSITSERLYKSLSFINSSVQIFLKLN